jgi:hypothetical protein
MLDMYFFDLVVKLFLLFGMEIPRSPLVKLFLLSDKIEMAIMPITNYILPL